MRYVVIADDGELHVKDGYWTDIEVLFRPEGWAGVRLHQATPMQGFRGVVNDVGLLMPEKFPRNIVGSLVLIALQAGQQPYAGPVVITGFQEPPNDDPDYTGLDDEQADLVTVLHADVKHALAGEQPTRPEDWEDFGGWLVWATFVRQSAEELRAMPTPGITIVSGGNLRDFLGGRS